MPDHELTNACGVSDDGGEIHRFSVERHVFGAVFVSLDSSPSTEYHWNEHRGDVPFGKALPPLFAGVVDCPYSVCVCCSLVESPDDGQCAERRCNDVGGQQVVAAELPEWEGLHR